MKKIMLTIILLLTGMFLLNTNLNVKAETSIEKTVSFTATSLGLVVDSYEENNKDHVSNDGLIYNTFDVKKGVGSYRDCIDLKAGTGLIKNTTPIPGVITNVSVIFYSPEELSVSSFVYLGTSTANLVYCAGLSIDSSDTGLIDEYTSSAILSNSFSHPVDSSLNYKFFSIDAHSQNNSYIRNVVITYLSESVNDDDNPSIDDSNDSIINDTNKKEWSLFEMAVILVIVCCSIFILRALFPKRRRRRSRRF